MQVQTNTIRRAFGAIALSGALALAAGCHKSVQASGPDPAQANLAPVNGQPQVLGENTSYAPQQQGENYPQQAPAPVQQGYPAQGYPQQYPQQAYPQQPQSYYPTPDEQAGEEALDQSTEAPPPLPEYDQPPAPGPGYIWTPGYWAWGPSGYYWVPGAWVEAPYYGALWTPPYWGWYNGYYRFHHGYWGPHVGYYGGIDYGFGYIGIGYFGGYWSGNSFYYNTAVTRVGGGVRTVYERPVVYNNVRYGVQPSSRVSYNGGHGGINVQPRAAEIAATRERHEPAMAVQSQARVAASQNRAQSFTENRGRPTEAFVQHGFANPRGIAPAPRGVETARPMPEGRPGQPNAPYVNERAANPAHGQPNAAERPAEPRVETRPMQPQPNAAQPRYENHAQPQPQPNAENPRFENRAQPQPQPRPEAPRTDNRPMQPQPQPRVENRPQPQPEPRVENRPMQPQPQPQPRVENRPQPQPQQQHMEAPRQESRPAPQPQARPQPQPQAHAAPQQPRGGGNNGHQGDGDHGHR